MLGFELDPVLLARIQFALSPKLDGSPFILL